MAAKSTNAKANPLFMLVDALFTSKEYINNITYETAKQNLFMVLRRLAIQYPLQANAFNDSKVNPMNVIKYWSDKLYTGGKTPGWIYPQGTKAQEKATSKKDITNADIKKYKEYYDINDKDFEFGMKFFPEEVKKEIIELRDFFKTINSNSYD